MFAYPPFADSAAGPGTESAAAVSTPATAAKAAMADGVLTFSDGTGVRLIVDALRSDLPTYTAAAAASTAESRGGSTAEDGSMSARKSVSSTVAGVLSTANAVALAALQVRAAATAPLTLDDSA